MPGAAIVGQATTNIAHVAENSLTIKRLTQFETARHQLSGPRGKMKGPALGRAFRLVEAV
jgi:hypothetical protein